MNYTLMKQSGFGHPTQLIVKDCPRNMESPRKKDHQGGISLLVVVGCIGDTDK